MAETDKAQMHHFLIHLMDELKTTSLYIPMVEQVLHNIFLRTSNYYTIESFALDASRRGILSVVVDFPEVFRFSGDCRHLELKANVGLNELLKKWEVPNRVKGLIKEHSKCLSGKSKGAYTIFDKNNNNEIKILNDSYIDWLCNTLEKCGGYFHTEMFPFSRIEQIEYVYLIKDLFELVSRCYGKKLYDKSHNESYIFSHEWKGVKVCIKLSKAKCTTIGPAYAVHKLEHCKESPTLNQLKFSFV